MTESQERTLQKKTLANLLSYREAGYRTYLSYLKRSFAKYVQLVLGHVLIVFICFSSGRPEYGIFIAGVLFGIVFWDYRRVASQNAFWPIHELILDWEKIEHLNKELGQ